MAKAKPPQVYQLKITLKNIAPPIWRRVQVPDCSLYELHLVIQMLLEWEGYHLWLFTIGKETYGDSSMEDDHDAEELLLSDLVKNRVKKFSYLYDFGDDWHHIIQIEKTVDAAPLVHYPHCVAGERAGPPEDSGGPWGYGNYVERLRDPNNQPDEERKEWFGEDFDPEAFDLAAINKRFAPRKPQRKKK